MQACTKIAFRFPLRIMSPRGRQFSCLLALFTCFTIPQKNKGMLIVYCEK